jgi:hypothetical protein
MGSDPEAHEARATNQRVASIAPLDRNSHAGQRFWQRRSQRAKRRTQYPALTASTNPIGTTGEPLAHRPRRRQQQTRLAALPEL